MTIKRKDLPFFLPGATKDDFEDDRKILTERPDIKYEEPATEYDAYEGNPEDKPLDTLDGIRSRVEGLRKSYNAIEKLSDLAQQRIDQRVGNYSVRLDKNADSHVIEAIKRAFPEAKDPTAITYEMYKQCLAKANLAQVPSVSNQDIINSKNDPFRTDFSGLGAPSGQNRPEVSSPTKMVEPLDLNNFQESILKKLFALLTPSITLLADQKIVQHKIDTPHG